jgi:hypothetical protein
MAGFFKKLFGSPPSSSFDPDRRLRAIEKIKSQGPIKHQHPLPVVSLEDFFEGNQDLGSIGCNLIKHPGIPKFFETLRSIRGRPDVQDVLIEIHELDETDESSWPFSERVYVYTTAEEKALSNWLAPLDPDEIEVGFSQGKPAAAPEPREGMRVLAAWWD